MLVAHMKKGLSYESFSAEIGTHRNTLYNWEKDHPEFLDAKKRGMDLCQAFFEKIGNAAMVGENVTNPTTGKTINFKHFNGPMWMFSMKARFGWRDRVSIEHEGNPDKPLEIKNRSDEEILKRVTELAAKLKPTDTQ